MNTTGGSEGAAVAADRDSTLAPAAAVAADRESTVAPTAAVAADTESTLAGNGGKEMANVPVVAGNDEEQSVCEHVSVDPPTPEGVDTSAIGGGEAAPEAEGTNTRKHVKFEPSPAAAAHTPAVAVTKNARIRRKAGAVKADGWGVLNPLPRDPVVAKMPSCPVCGVLAPFQGLSDECCANWLGQPCPPMEVWAALRDENEARARHRAAWRDDEDSSGETPNMGKHMVAQEGAQAKPTPSSPADRDGYNNIVGGTEWEILSSDMDKENPEAADTQALP